MPIASSIVKPAGPKSAPARPVPLRTDLGPASARKKRKPGAPLERTALSPEGISPFGAAPQILESLAAVTAPLPMLPPVRTAASLGASVLASPVAAALGAPGPPPSPTPTPALTRGEAREADASPATATSTDSPVAEAAPLPEARPRDAAAQKSQEPQEAAPKETVAAPEMSPRPAVASDAPTAVRSSVADGKAAAPKPAGSDTASEPGEPAEKSSKSRPEAPQSLGGAASSAPSGSGPIAAPPLAVQGPAPTAKATAEPVPAGGEPVPASEDSAEGAAEAAEPAPPQPARDAGLQATVAGVQGAAATQRAHAPPGAKAAEAAAAALGPPGEVAAMAGARQVGVMDQQEAPPFNREAFVAQLTGRIEEVTPKTLDEADKFKENNRVGGLTGILATAVETITGGSAGNVAQATQAAPDQAGIEPKPVTELPPAAKAAKPVVATDAAVPAPASDERISLEAEIRTLDDQMAKGGITRTQLEKSNEPTFQSALAAKDAAQQSAAAAPGEYRAAEKQTLDTARGENAAAVSQQLGEMAGVRGQTLGNVLGKQGGAKSEEEAKRVEITQAIQGIYDQTKTDVEARLAKLDGEVNARFESAATAARATFEEHVETRLADYKKKRYEGIIGAFLEVKDLLGLPSEVDAFYVEGKQRYIDAMKSSINDIATLVESGLLEAKSRIAAGKKQVTDYVQSQPKALQKIAKQAAGTIGAQFDQLEQGVNDKQNQIVDGLVARYQENLKSLDERIEELKEKNKGAIGSAFDAMAGVGQTIGELAATLRGLLAKIADVVVAIVADPIGFLDNLVTGVSTGLKNFVANIAGHMKEGFFAWLFGAMAAAGITMPAQWDLKGVFGLLMQILGATYNFIRARAVSLVGEKVVSTIETTATFFQKLATEGPISLWEDLKESLGNVVQTAIDGIKTFLTETVIKAGIQWLLSLLTPASAFVKAAKTIIDVVTFFFTRGKQLMELVGAIVDSIAAIAKGSLGAAAQFVEKSLAKALPVAIGFLASLIGLGGLTDRVQKIMAQLQKPITKAIDWLISKMMGLARKAKKAAGPNEKPDVDHDRKLSLGVAFLKEASSKKMHHGKISQSAATIVASRARTLHPVFSSIVVQTNGGIIQFHYTGSPIGILDIGVADNQIVWVNTKSGKYHSKTSSHFHRDNKADHWKRMPESQATAAGYTPAITFEDIERGNKFEKDASVRIRREIEPEYAMTSQPRMKKKNLSTEKAADNLIQHKSDDGALDNRDRPVNEPVSVSMKSRDFNRNIKSADARGNGGMNEVIMSVVRKDARELIRKYSGDVVHDGKDVKIMYVILVYDKSLVSGVVRPDLFQSAVNQVLAKDKIAAGLIIDLAFE